MNKKTNILFALYCLLQTFNAHADNIAGTYTLWNKGSAQSNALGGATIALDGEGAPLLDNTAASLFQGSNFNWHFGYANPDDSLHDVTAASINQREDFALLEASLLLYKRVSIVGGAQVLRFFADDQVSQNSVYRFQNTLTNFHLGLGIKVGSIGVAVTYLKDTANQSLTTETLDTVLDQNKTVQGNALKYSSLLKLNDYLNIGIAHTQSTLLQPNTEDKSILIFDNGYVPRISQIGLLLSSSARNGHAYGIFPTGVQIFAQADYLKFDRLGPKDIIYSASSLAFTPKDPTILDTKDKLIPKVGLEINLFTSEDFALVSRAGSYLEPGYFQNDKPRLHRTVGVFTRLWFLTATAAWDRANGYISRNLGIGFEISRI